MFEQLGTQIGKLLGKPGEDQTSTITADQLKVVLKSIEGKYNNLKNENKLYKSKLEEQKSTIAELERAVGEMKSGGDTKPADAGLLTQLESDLDTARKQFTDAQETVASLRAEKLQFQSKLSVQEALVSSLRHELSELREGHAGAASPEEHAKALAEVERLRFDNQQLNAKVQDLLGQTLDGEHAKSQLLEAQISLGLVEEEAASLRQDVAEVRAQIENAAQARTQAIGEREGALMAQSEAEAARAELQAKLTPALEEVEELTEQIDMLQMQRDALEAAAKLKGDEAEQQRSRADTAEETLAQFEQDKGELRHQVVKLQTEVEGLHQQLLSGGPQAQVLAELEERVLDGRAKLEHAQSENQALQARIQQLVDEPAGLSAREKTEFEIQLRRIGEELREATLQIASLREAKVKANLDLEEAAAELVELRRQLDEMRRDRNTYRDRIEDSRSQAGEMDQLKQQMREIMNQVQAARTSGPVQPATPIETPQPQARPAAQAPEPPPVDARPSGNSEAALARRREMLNRLIGDKKKS